jgi:hypothetical protein
MFVLNPDPFLLPSFRISPFTTAYMAKNNNLPEDRFLADYCNDRFGKNNWQYTTNGREGIQLALENYGLEKDDLVTILTTSENFYISSCVTGQISNFCRWNRELLPETKVIFVNHEFGYPYPDMERLLATGLPIIEDCCTTFFSQDAFGKTGKYGDFSIYSFPKFFPLQIGGLLVSNKNKAVRKSAISAEEIRYIENVVSKDLRNETALLQKRRQNYAYGLSLFSDLGFSGRFEKNEAIVPSLLLLNNNRIVNDPNALKAFLNSCGIQNSVFYGEDAFFLPSHQNLEPSDYDYFLACVKQFLKSQ